MSGISTFMSISDKVCSLVGHDFTESIIKSIKIIEIDSKIIEIDPGFESYPGKIELIKLILLIYYFIFSL